MRKLSLFIFVLLHCNLIAQSNISTPMDFYIEKEVIPAVLNVVPGTLQFVDQDNNNVIDANETCKIRFQIVNSGRGEGYGCVARATFAGNTQGISISDVRLPIIPAGSKQWVEIPISANAYTQTGEIALNIVVDEPNGFGTEKIESIIGTHKLKTPYINVVSYKVLGSTSGTLERRRPFSLQVIVQNTDQGVAENVKVGISMPNNVNRIGGESEYVTIASLQAGESRTLEYELIANQEAAEKMDIQIALSEKQGKYAEDASIPLQFGQHIGSSIAMNVERRDHDVAIERQSLVSKVDENIPQNGNLNNKLFAVIIANENYQSVASVPYALNDGNIFREYCIKTLGVPEKQLKYIPNATGNQIKAQVNWLQNICEVFEDAQIIFYYAGHGIPDESSRTAYLLPVDGIGTDISTGYKLDNLYAALGNIPAKNVTVFMDACFSGSKRENGMLASARGVAIKARSGMPQGNMVVFSAAQGDETAYPNNEEKHGMFTYFLLKKLQETAGDVTLQELGEYITKNVSQQSILLNGKSQTPCVTPSATLDASWREWKLK
ncbi:MAG: caspase family protein [Paludibacteraceae bacterium]|nr:caspase family protein [Paludibacteraceae bacterium]